VLPGIWRLRLPLPWPGVPHVNAYALSAGSGVVLVDTGLGEPGALAQLELALDGAGLRLEHVRLVVCTHAHSDHYGLAGAVVRAAGCELWMHPNHKHLTDAAADPDRALERRLEVAAQCGVPREPLERYREQRRGQGSGVSELVMPDRELLPGVVVDTDVGPWEVYETPGHAPSHVVLHQPERGLLLSGDHLLGRVSLYYDFGWTPDPAGEFLMSLDVVDELKARLCLAGHGRPFRDVHALVRANRREVLARIERVTHALAPGPLTAFELVPAVLDRADLDAMLVSWGLSQALCYLTYLEQRDEVRRLEPDGEGEPERWALAR
jgi:glyoxylase-like metal-dependent hydrolase (beta-lactamase superfamily II)